MAGRRGTLLGMAEEQPRFLQGLEQLHSALSALERPARRTVVTVIPKNQTTGFQINAEVAETPQALANGLMFRRELGQDEGMLFLFPDVRPRFFWMKNTLIWLDMIFIGPDNEIVGVIHNARPLSEELRGFDTPVKAVLEVNAGWCWSHNIDAGGFVTWPEDQEKEASRLSHVPVLDGPDTPVKKIKVQGIPVDIERPKGTIKIFPDKSTQYYRVDYGSTPLAKGTDGDPLDVFVGPDKRSKRVFVVDKMDDKDHSKFEENKVMLGFKDRAGAREAAKFHLGGTGGKIKEMPVGKLQAALGVEKRAAEFAPGIPEKGRFVSIPDIQKPTTWEFGLHLHKAHRAGSHFDLRLGDPTTGEAHSWALKKLPEPGKSTYAPQQSTHTIEYMDWKGEIPVGTYGAGTVELVRRDKAEVLKANDNEIRFNLYQSRIPEQFVLKRQTGRMWTLHNITPSRNVKKWQELIPTDKPSMSNIPIGKLSPADPTEVWQPKIDGAHAIAVLEPNKPMRLFSYREAKNQTGLIEHTFRMPNFHENVVPPGIRPTVLRGEIWGEKDGKPIHVSQLGGILNASVPESRKRQEAEKIKLHFTAFDVERYDGKKVGPLPFERTDQILKDLAAQVSGIEVMPTATTAAQKQRLLQEVQSGRHKLTREGLVVRSREKAYKAKQFDPYDVFIRQVYPGTKPGEAGGFRYSWTEHGPIVGNVGSGLTHKQRRDMLLNPENWVGRVAKVLAQEKLRSGALRMPVFTGFHETKGLQPYHEIATSD